MSKKLITISRQFGSGGRDIALLVSKKLDIPFYDNELLTMAAEHSNIHPDIAKDVDENANKGFLGVVSSSIYSTDASGFLLSELPINDRLYIAQSNLIKMIAEQGDAVIVGRCADCILKDYDELVNVFIHADINQRIEKIMRQEDVNKEKAKKLITKTDKRRSTYYNYYTNNKWGRAENHHLSIDSKVGYEKVADIIIAYTEK